MHTHADKTQENKSRSVANAFSQNKSSGNSTFQFVDNRAEAIDQRKLQEIANNSPQAKQATQLQAMANNYSAQQQQPIQKKKNNTGLPDNLKSGIENLSGYAMDDVKVHRNSDKPAQLQAHAYAQGTDIHLGPGQEKHLPHEAWHVVQQKQGRVKPTMQMKGNINVNDDAGLEKEANVMGVKAVQLKSILSTNTTPNQQSYAMLLPSPVVQKMDDMRFLPAIDLKGYIEPSSGRSGNIVLLGYTFVYKLFNPTKTKEYDMEVGSATTLKENGVPVLFDVGLGKRKVIMPDGTTKDYGVIRMWRATGKTYMLAKDHTKPFLKVVFKNYGNSIVHLKNLSRYFRTAHNLGVSDPQFIYEVETNTPHFMDVHTGGGGIYCKEVANAIDERLSHLLEIRVTSPTGGISSSEIHEI